MANLKLHILVHNKTEAKDHVIQQMEPDLGEQPSTKMDPTHSLTSLGTHFLPFLQVQWEEIDYYVYVFYYSHVFLQQIHNHPKVNRLALKVLPNQVSRLLSCYCRWDPSSQPKRKGTSDDYAIILCYINGFVYVAPAFRRTTVSFHFESWLNCSWPNAKLAVRI